MAQASFDPSRTVGVVTVTPAFEVIVRGNPGPQGSKRHVGGGRMIEMSKKVKPWRADVVEAAIAVRAGAAALDCPLAVEMVFTAVRPKSHYRTGRNAHLLRDGAPVQPTSPPDLSKLARSTEDALETAGVFRSRHRPARPVSTRAGHPTTT